MLQKEEQHIRLTADRTQSDAESRIDVFQKESMTAMASEQACLTSMEGERAARCELTARLAVIEMSPQRRACACRQW